MNWLLLKPKKLKKRKVEVSDIDQASEGGKSYIIILVTNW